ncbi:L-xylulose reductase [Halotydeus destructor]|nr:L-xylulose reductase [Halotydeus destructor]
MDIRFEGKRVLVTGAGRGIGRETAKRLVAFGAKVIAVSRSQGHLDELKKELPSIEILAVDLSNWFQTAIAIKSLLPVDLLVNNAAYAELTPVVDQEISEDVIDKHFDVNVKGAINVLQIVANDMKSRGVNGSIVNVSSQAAIAALKDHMAYAASKGALDAVTKVAALEFGPFNIRVNSVNPTVTMTDMAKVGWSDPATAKAMTDKIPLNRFAQPEEVVDAIVYLLSDKSSMVSGILMPIDGGFLAC